jgi:teichoic acid transport system permease protein
METQSPSPAPRGPSSETVTVSDAATVSPPHRRDGQGDFTAGLQVFEPHRVGLPPIGPYVRELWGRRQFAFELARTNLRKQHFNTALGQLWLVINPLLLALVYFLLVEIVAEGARGPQFLAHLMVGLFAFRFMSGSLKQGARSVVGGGRLILNTAFPRIMLPLASVMTGFMRFLPTLVVYAVMHALAGLAVGPHLLWTLPIFALLFVFTAGMTMLVAAAQVYFRDLASFLPYFTRIWLYASPVLYYADEVPDRFQFVMAVNPLYPLLASLSDITNAGEAPSAAYLAWGLAWALGALVVGLLFFISREREFAVRL